MAASVASSGSLASTDAAARAQLFEDLFEVVNINPEGKKFERVNRMVCKAMTLDVDMIIDIASEVYSLRPGERFAFVLTSTLRLDGRPDDDAYDQSGRESLLDDYEYGMCGRVFDYKVSGERVSLIASFGGLLMKMDGDKRQLSAIELDARIYALIRKSKSLD